MKRSFKNISKLMLVAGCVTVLGSNITSAAPLVYDMSEPEVRTEYSAPNKIRLEGDVRFDQAQTQKINLSLRNTDVQQVLRMFADKAGLNIVFHSSAQGSVTLDLVDVSLEDAFKMVMKMTNLTYVIKDKTMMVVATSDAEQLNLTKDNIAILPVKYADAAYIAHFLNSNVFSLNTAGLSYGPIVTTNAERNELLIFGTDNDYQMAKKIVDRFDKKPVMTTYRVNHTTPFEMAKMVCETLFDLPAAGDQQGGGMGGQNITSNLNASFKMNGAEDSREGSLGGGFIACSMKSSVTTNSISSYQAKPSLSIYVQPDLGTMTLVGGSEQQIQLVNDFIIENDRKQPQAYLEIAIISLNEEGSRTLSNEWEWISTDARVGFAQDGNFSVIGGKDAAGVEQPVQWQGIAKPHQIQTLNYKLKALIQNSKARVLANPKIVITNGKKSTIDLTQDYVKTTTAQILQSSSGTSNGIQKTYETGEDNGIKIEITPFISPDGYVSLKMKPEYSSVYDTIYDDYPLEAGGQIVYTKILAATLLQRHNLELENVRIKDEETLFIGGMVKETEGITTSKIPILGDLPLIGFLFRNQSKAMLKEELLFMITPRIIKDTEDVADL